MQPPSPPTNPTGDADERAAHARTPRGARLALWIVLLGIVGIVAGWTLSRALDSTDSLRDPVQTPPGADVEPGAQTGVEESGDGAGAESDAGSDRPQRSEGTR